jgi:hypothetical protein
MNGHAVSIDTNRRGRVGDRSEIDRDAVVAATRSSLDDDAVILRAQHFLASFAVTTQEEARTRVTHKQVASCASRAREGTTEGRRTFEARVRFAPRAHGRRRGALDFGVDRRASWLTPKSPEAEAEAETRRRRRRRSRERVTG